MIKPTVGRVVLFHPEKGSSRLAVQTTVEGNQPIPALVCCVHSDTCINIAGFDANGAPFSRTSVPLLQDDVLAPAHAYAEWMPYQKAQAAKETAAPSASVTTVSNIESEIAKKASKASRVTPEDIEANIASEFYFTAAEGVLGESAMGTRPAGRAASLNELTFCVLVLRNGFTVTGESACASPENFDKEIGRKIARANAVNKIWPLMGYELKSLLAQGQAVAS